MIVNTDGTFTYTPTDTARHNAAADSATPADLHDSFTVTVNDAHGGTVTVPVSVAIGPHNLAPTAGSTIGAPDPATGVITGSVSATDPEADPLSYTGSTTTTKGAAIVNTDGTFTYTPTDTARHNAAAETATATDKHDNFTVTVNDAHGGLVTVPVSVTIDPNNTAPAANATIGAPDPATGVITGTVSATDPEADPLSYTGSTTTTKGAVTVNTDGTFTYTPTDTARHNAAADTATTTDKHDSFTVTVNDAHGGTTTIPVSVAISPTNTAPTGTAHPGTPDPATGVITGTVSATDPEADPLSYTGSTTTTKGAVTVNTDGTFTYTPTDTARHNAAADTATTTDKHDSFTVTVNDAHGGTTTIPVSVAISPTNTAPTGTAHPGTPDPATGVITGTVSATDPEADPLSYTGSTTTTKGAVTVNTDGTFTYTPTDTARHNAAADTATATDKHDSFTVTVNDAHGGTTTIPVSVAISPTNDPPAATAAPTRRHPRCGGGRDADR